MNPFLIHSFSRNSTHDISLQTDRQTAFALKILVTEPNEIAQHTSLPFSTAHACDSTSLFSEKLAELHQLLFWSYNDLSSADDSSIQ